MDNRILLPEGTRIGHADNGKTGLTTIIFEGGAVGGVDVRGCAPGTRETDLLRPEKAIELVNAIVMTGGSAYGLGSLDGVIKYLREQGEGHKMGNITVPLVAGAVIYDLGENGYDFPDNNMGYECAKSAVSTDIKWGRIGVGTGATIGKIAGAGCASRGGVSASTVALGGLFVTAVTAVNALGDVYDSDSGKIVSGAKLPDGAFLDTERFILSGEILKLFKGNNTTLSVVMTNAKLDKLHANKLASIAHDGYAKSIRPVHTDYDGDTIFAVSKGEVVTDFTLLSVMAVEAVRRSVIAAVS